MKSLFKKKWVIVLPLLFLIIVGSLGTFFLKKRGKEEAISTWGIIEAQEVNISSKIAGRISYINGHEGDKVKRGDLLVMLEKDEYLAQVSQAKATVEQTRAYTKKTEADVVNIKENIENARANIKSWEATIEKDKILVSDTKRTLERAVDLLKQNLISVSEKDSAQTNYDSSQAQLKADMAQREKAVYSLRSNEAQLASMMAEIDSSRAQTKEAEANLRLREIQLSNNSIFAPANGVITLRAAEEGEMIAPGATILTIVNLDRLWVRLDMDETLIGKIKNQMPSMIKVASYPDKLFSGRVIEIGEEGGFATNQDVWRGRPDIKTFRVKVLIEDGQTILKPGMTALVRFDLGRQRE